ncbi:hypothetical protein OVA06_01325 [Pseudarthrobacter sp. SL88]|uniref:hypothetical protein n=1 Tax=Pseudarthrobacter sp. SL88 TaxID=2994666 RepID=UPI0022728077|nr:hypothetical protein [Pseudarthrobacter sp. SL88]MCY1673368.1 hypothetical protein [Pseudarthrobacter sp. SL88]
MSITPTLKTRSIRAKMALVPALTLGLLGGAAVIAAPAQANDNYRNGCTVKPLTPQDARGDWVNFPVSVRCGDGKKLVHIQQKRYEKDRGRDTKLHEGMYDGFTYYVHRGDRYEIVDRYDRVSRKLDRRGPEEVYHEIRFAVVDRNGRLEWSGWMRSGTLTGVNSHG